MQNRRTHEDFADEIAAHVALRTSILPERRAQMPEAV